MTRKAPAIVIAAGGDGTRMGGEKPERRLAGLPLLEHALRWATGATNEIAIAVRAHNQITEPSVPILLDRIADIGPISALESAFRFAGEQGREKVMLIGCDQPFLPSDLAVRLDSKIAGNGCAMPVSNRKDHPMAALWHVDSAGLADYISAGGRSLWRFAERVGVIRIDWGEHCEPDPFANINDAAALAEAGAWFNPGAD